MDKGHFLCEILLDKSYLAQLVNKPILQKTIKFVKKKQKIVASLTLIFFSILCIIETDKKILRIISILTLSCCQFSEFCVLGNHVLKLPSPLNLTTSDFK